MEYLEMTPEELENKLAEARQEGRDEIRNQAPETLLGTTQRRRVEALREAHSLLVTGGALFTGSTTTLVKADEFQVQLQLLADYILNGFEREGFVEVSSFDGEVVLSDGPDSEE